MAIRHKPAAPPAPAGEPGALSPGEWRRTLHELEAHQIELEMQNEALRQSQEALERARASYFDLYELAPVGYCTVSHDSVIIEANLTSVAMLGLPPGGLMGQPLTRFIHRDDQDLYDLLWKQFHETEGPQAGELRMVKQDGTVIWVYLSATPIRQAPTLSQAEAAMLPIARLVMTDIDLRKQAEATATRLDSELHQAQGLKTLGVLAGGVAHVINNLLTSILGNASLGTLAVEADGKVAAYFAAIEKATQRAADLTAQLLAYAGKGKYWVTEVDLDLVVKEVLQRLVPIPSPSDHVTFHFDRADRLPFVMGDASQIGQLLTNLLRNALEAFGDDLKGQITVRTHSEALDPPAIASIHWTRPGAPGHYATLEVTDTGCGMTPEVQARAFEPFFTTHFTGRGLGLAAVMGILSSHGGGISVHSEPGRGSSFKIYLPAMREARSRQVAAGPPAWRGQGKLLVADEDAAMRTAVRQMAEALGFTIVEARGGPEAVDTFRLRHGDLALVLLDRGLGRQGGSEPFHEIRQIDRQVPVVLTSAYDAPDPGALPEGLAGTIKKPYRIAELQGLLQRTLV